MGGALPVPEFKTLSRRDIDIYVGVMKISLWYEAGEDIDTREATVNIYNKDLEKKLFQIFPDKDVTKKLYDHIFTALEKYIEGRDGKLVRKGDTQFCG